MNWTFVADGSSEPIARSRWDPTAERLSSTGLYSEMWIADVTPTHGAIIRSDFEWILSISMEIFKGHEERSGISALMRAIETSDYLVRPRLTTRLQPTITSEAFANQYSNFNGTNCRHPAKIIPGENKLCMPCICTKHEKGRGERKRENIASSPIVTSLRSLKPGKF